LTNRAALSGRLLEKKAKRFTPAGIPVLEILLAHESSVTEAGASRLVKFEFKAKAMGSVAEALEQMALGSSMKIEGFMAPPRLLSRQIMVHITNFELE